MKRRQEKKGSVPPLVDRRTDIWDVNIERYEVVGYFAHVQERGSLVAGTDWCLTRGTAQRWAARFIRNKRRQRARQAEKYTIGPEPVVKDWKP